MKLIKILKISENRNFSVTVSFKLILWVSKNTETEIEKKNGKNI